MKIDKNFVVRIGDTLYPGGMIEKIEIEGGTVKIKWFCAGDYEDTGKVKDVEFLTVHPEITRRKLFGEGKIEIKVRDIPRDKPSHIRELDNPSCVEWYYQCVESPVEVVKKAVAEVLAEELERTVEVEMNIDGKSLGKWIHKYTD